jgi:hypothetical protein
LHDVLLIKRDAISAGSLDVYVIAIFFFSANQSYNRQPLSLAVKFKDNIIKNSDSI